MQSDYRDTEGAPLTRDEVYRMPTEDLAAASGMPLRIMPDHGALYEAVADTMVRTVEQGSTGKMTMILPVGPVGQYPVFGRKVAEQRLDCRNLWTFNMDEFLDRAGRTVPLSHPMSFKAVMMEELYSKLPEKLRMPKAQMHFPRHDTMEQTDRALDEHAPDGVDLCIAGVGPEGHFAFNEDPNYAHVRVSEEEFLRDRTHLVVVRESTVDMDALVASCGDRSAVPPFAVTLGPRDILRARRMEVVFFAGTFQRVALRETLFRRPTMRFPGSLLKVRVAPDGSVAQQDITVWTTPQEAGPVTSRTI